MGFNAPSRPHPSQHFPTCPQADLSYSYFMSKHAEANSSGMAPKVRVLRMPTHHGRRGAAAGLGTPVLPPQPRPTHSSVHVARPNRS